jgi:hypothetical protein
MLKAKYSHDRRVAPRHLRCLIAFASLSVGPGAIACSCLESDLPHAAQVKVAFEEAYFVATVEIVSTAQLTIAKEESGRRWSWEDREYHDLVEVRSEEVLVAEFNVLEPWKGDSQTRSVATASAWQGCGLAFQPGQKLLLYTTGPDEEGRLRSDSCSRTTLLEDAASDIEVLKSIKPAAAPLSVPTSSLSLGLLCLPLSP